MSADTRSHSAPEVVVVDAGKQGLEHFEFNRGVMLSLARGGLAFRLVGTRSMCRAHAGVPGLRATSAFGEFWQAVPTRARQALFKLFSPVLAVCGLVRAREALLVLYATPLAHLALALLSHVVPRRCLVFVHAEIEFMAAGDGRPRLLGEHLIQWALTTASRRRVTYLTLTSAAAQALKSHHGVESLMCPHPMSPSVLVEAEGGAASASRRTAAPTALVFFKGQGRGAWAQRLCDLAARALPLNVNGLVCTLPDARGVWSFVQPLTTLRRFLTRRELEQMLSECALYVLPVAEDEYCFTASGLACSAAGVGALVLGAPNAFMCDYQSRYPSHFKAVSAHEEVPAGGWALPTAALDNLHEVGEMLRGLLLDGGARR